MTGYKNGFTFIEFWIVMSILGLMVAIIVPSFIKAKQQSEMEKLPPDQAMEKHKESLNLRVECVVDGYNIWSLNDGNGRHYLAIPKTNSVVLEKP